MKRQELVQSNAMAPPWRGMLLAVLVVVTSHVATTAQRASFPARLETYLTNAVRLTGDERQRLLNGEPVTKLLDADESKEVAIFGAVWVKAPMRRYVEAVS